ncbi:MAG: DUF354 domain-containing protein [Candidatus Hydrothermarchaeota archaeon]|nr:DUF354 domain-containing protein [Candidatus Hydrothermarchaeota archaeon]
MIWIDITNLPHALFFEGIIKKSHAFVTTREFGSLTKILEAKGIDYTLVGKHGGREPKEKLAQSARRILNLAKILSKQQVEICVAKQSVELPRVAFGLDLPCIQVVDNEYAEHQNRLTLALCSRVLVPRALDDLRLLQQGAEKDKIVSFNGLCELAHIRNFNPGRRIIKDDYVLLRPGPRFAAYFKGEEIIQGVIDSVSRSYRVLILPRSGESYKNASIPRTRDSCSLIYHAAAFIGGGGTMNRESALLGTPTVSYYPQELLGVDEFLIEKKLMTHAPNLGDIPAILEETVERKEGLRRRAKKLRGAMEDPIDALEREINSLMAQP